MKSGKDYTGQKRAMLTFVRFDKRIGNHTYWFCKCDCGKLKSLRVSHVSEKDTQSCGCKKMTHFKKQGANRILNSSFSGYKRFSKKIGRQFSITFLDFAEIVKNPCFYCGHAGDVKYLTTLHGKSTITDIFNGIDRKDNSIGYVKENCLPCCKMCNYMKGSYGHEEFISKCHLISSNFNKI